MNLKVEEPHMAKTFVAVRNRVWAGAFLFFALVLGLAAVENVSNTSALTFEILIALECLYFGARLLATSSLSISHDHVQFRTKHFKRRSIATREIESVSEASRVFVYQRVFPRLKLFSGESIDLINFEESQLRRRQDGGSVSSIVSLVKEALDASR
jgi:hypothetical protein